MRLRGSASLRAYARTQKGTAAGWFGWSPYPRTIHPWSACRKRDTEGRRDGGTEGQREKRGGWTVIRLMTLRFILPLSVFLFFRVMEKTAGASERKTAGTRDGMVRASARVRDQHTPSAQ